MQFKGGCNKCGNYGHKSTNCPDNGKSKDTKNRTMGFQGKCWYYGIGGHKIEKCKKLREIMLAEELCRAEYAADIIGDDVVELAL